MPRQFLFTLNLLACIFTSFGQDIYTSEPVKNHTQHLPKDTGAGLKYNGQDSLPALSTPLRDVWIGKIFSDSMWTFVPRSESNEACTLQGRQYGEQLMNNTHWAVRMFDASAVSVSGLLDGDTIQYGHADQCVYTQVPLVGFTTQYCLPTAVFAPQKSDLRREFFNNRSLADWPPYDTGKTIWDFLRPRAANIRDTRTRFSWGICVPESCSSLDIQTSLQTALGEAFSSHGIDFQVELNSLMCYSAKEVKNRQMPLPGQIFVYFLLVLVLLVVIGTTVDYVRSTQNRDELKPSKENPFAWFLITFSFSRNLTRLCTGDPGEELLIIHAVKFLAMCFVIMFHRALVGMAYSQNLALLEEILHDARYFALNASSQMLDIFFFMAGFLLARIIIQRRDQDKQPISPLFIIFYRALRIYPMLLTAIAFTTWVQPYIGEGPRWKAFAISEQTSCKRHWWHNVLFIASLFEYGDMCVPVSWFLSTDFQLFLLSLAIICVAERFPKYRVATLTTSFIVAHVVPSLVLYYKQEVSLWQMTVGDGQNIPQSHYIRTVYEKFYIRSPPYIYGVCGAYAMQAAQKMDFKFTGIQKVFLTIFLTTLQPFMFYVGALFLAPGKEYNVWHHVLFAPVMRWTLPTGMFMLLWVHMNGGVGIVSQFLSHPIFIPLGRITFHMYLIHFYVQCWDILTLYSAPHYSMFTFVLRSCGDILLTIILSLGTTLLIESPLGIIRKKLLKI